MNIFVRLAFLFLSFSVFAQATDEETINNLKEAGNKEEVELDALRAFLGQYRDIILFENCGEELSPDEALLVTTAQSTGNDSKTISKISIKNLPAEKKEIVVSYRIDKASKLYYELEQMQLVKNAIDLIPEDVIIFENLLAPSAYWNISKTLEDSVKIFKSLANTYKNISSQMGCLEFENFLGFESMDQASYVWFETKEYVKGELLKELEERYQSYRTELSKTKDKSSVQLPAPFVSSQDKEKLFREKPLNKSFSGLIVINGRTYQRELFWKEKFLRRPAHWNDCQTNLFMSQEIHMDYFPLKEQFNSVEYTKVIQLQHFCHLKKKNDYQEKEKNSKTIFVIWPTGKIVPRNIVLDSSSFSWLSLCKADPDHPERPLRFTVLTDTLDGTCAGVYITKQEPTREQILIVELSYARAHEITFDTFNEMKKAYHEQSSEKFWESTNLAGVNLRDIDLLIIVHDKGKLYLPRSMSEQILPSYLVEVPVTIVSDLDRGEVAQESSAEEKTLEQLKNLSLRNDDEKKEEQLSDQQEDGGYSPLSVKTLVNRLEALLLEKKS